MPQAVDIHGEGKPISHRGRAFTRRWGSGGLRGPDRERAPARCAGLVGAADQRRWLPWRGRPASFAARAGSAGFLVGRDLAADDLAVERERLQHDVEATVVLVREDEADVEPVVVLALAPDHGIGAVRRLARFFVRHGNSPFELVAMSCVSRHQGRTAWCLPARIAAGRKMAGTADRVLVGGASSRKTATVHGR